LFAEFTAEEGHDGDAFVVGAEGVQRLAGEASLKAKIYGEASVYCKIVGRREAGLLVVL
jgi:hypothetical protein